MNNIILRLDQVHQDNNNNNVIIIFRTVNNKFWSSGNEPQNLKEATWS